MKAAINLTDHGRSQQRNKLAHYRIGSDDTVEDPGQTRVHG